MHRERQVGRVDADVGMRADLPLPFANIPHQFIEVAHGGIELDAAGIQLFGVEHAIHEAGQPARRAADFLDPHHKLVVACLPAPSQNALSAGIEDGQWRAELVRHHRDEVSIRACRLALTIEGRKPETAAREYLYQGIAARPFRRVFNLADYVQVKQAAFQDGLLLIDLVREVPEAAKPRRIPIAGAAPATSQIEQKKAA